METNFLVKIAFTWNIKPLADSFLVENTKPQIPEIPRNCLRLVEWLGSSVQGEVLVLDDYNKIS